MSSTHPSIMLVELTESASLHEVPAAESLIAHITPQFYDAICWMYEDHAPHLSLRSLEPEGH